MQLLLGDTRIVPISGVDPAGFCLNIALAGEDAKKRKAILILVTYQDVDWILIYFLISHDLNLNALHIILVGVTVSDIKGVE